MEVAAFKIFFFRRSHKDPSYIGGYRDCQNEILLWNYIEWRKKKKKNIQGNSGFLGHQR